VALRLNSTSAYRLKLLYTYQNGQYTQQTLGNGVITNRNDDAVSGTLGSQTSSVGGGTGVQNESYH
jgi:hypothetical protein